MLSFIQEIKFLVLMIAKETKEASQYWSSQESKYQFWEHEFYVIEIDYQAKAWLYLRELKASETALHLGNCILS